MIPYFICLLIIGFPILVLELSIGQRLRQGASGAYVKFHKGFAGLGLSMVIGKLKKLAKIPNDGDP